jgi:serine/threonine protein kinase
MEPVLVIEERKEEAKSKAVKVGDFYYSKSECLGKGQFGTVFKARYKKDDIDEGIALKTLDRVALRKSGREEDVKAYIESEAISLFGIRSDNVVAYKGFEKSRNEYFLGIEFCNGGDLDHVIKKFGGLDEYVIQHIFI